MYETQVESTVALYWVHDAAATDNLYTTNTTEVSAAVAAGQTNEGIVAYIFPSEICGSVPFYHLRSSVDNFYTTSASERDSAVASGYTYVGIMGYVGYQNLCKFCAEFLSVKSNFWQKSCILFLYKSSISTHGIDFLSLSNSRIQLAVYSAFMLLQ